MEDGFLKRKNDVLSKLDKSFIGGWDEKIKDLCEKLNSLENYYTTSSCSGRVVLMIDEDEKKPGLFIKVYHDKISLGELKKKLTSFCSEIGGPEPEQVQGSLLDRDDNRKNILVNSSKKFLANENEQVNIKFKMEPCILHVACKTLEDAQKLFDKAKLSGWKRSGIIASGNRFMLELNSTEKLEFPIIYGGEVLVGDKFLEIVVKEANEKLENSWKKIEKLRKLLE